LSSRTGTSIQTQASRASALHFNSIRSGSVQTAKGSIAPPTTDGEATALFCWAFAPGAIGFRAIMRVPLNGDPLAGAHVAAYIGARPILQQVNTEVRGRWRMDFKLHEAASGAKKRYTAWPACSSTCRSATAARRRRRLPGHRRPCGRLTGRAEHALLRRAQARQRRRRQRRLPVHGTSARRAPDRSGRSSCTAGAGPGVV
jgi:hypothetical protein